MSASPSPSPGGVSGERGRLFRFFPYLAPLLILAAMIIGNLIFLRPQLRVYRELRSSVLAEEVSQLAATVDRFSRAKVTLGEITPEYLRAIDAAAPGGEDTPALFTVIDAAAQRAGVTPVSIEIGREAASKKAEVSAGNDTLVIGLSIRNVDYPRLKSFLGALAASQRLLDVRSVQFSPQSLSANVQLRAYSID